MPLTRRVVVAAVLIEALVVAGYGLFLGVELLSTEAADRVGAAFLILVVLALAAGLVAVARALGRGLRGARAPVLVWQALQASVAVPALSTQWYVGAALLALCVVAGVGVFRDDVIVDPGD